MRIAVLVYEFPKLSETFILHQITGLLDRGHEVDIFANYPADEPTAHAEAVGLRFSTRINYRIPRPKPRVTRFSKGVGFVIEGLVHRPGAVLNALNFLRHGKQATSLSLLYHLAPYLAKERYDIVHCHFGPNGNRALYLKDLGALEGKLVTTFHGIDVSSYLKMNDATVYDRLFREGDLFFCVSRYIQNKVARLGCERNKTEILHMGVDTRRISYRPPHPCADRKFRILSVGRLVEKKGIRFGIEAVAKILSKHPSLEYLIVGDGPLRGELESMIDQLNLRQSVHLLGWKNQEEIIELLGQVDLLMAPSVTSEDGDQEGIPVTLMEGMAHGLPILSTQHSGIPELVEDGHSGFLVDEKDSEALSQRLELLLSRPNLRIELGKAGRLQVEQNFDLDKTNDQLLAAFERLGSGRST